MLVCALAAVLAAACGGSRERATTGTGRNAATATGPAPAPANVPNDGTPTRVDVGGYRLAVRCSGRGKPAVVLEAGYGLSSARWRATQRAVRRTNRVCSYDRQGVGRSDVRPPEAGDPTTAEELHALVAAVGLEAPYVLAGHSLGGALALGYASAYRDDVLGVVLVDSVHPARLPLGAAKEGRSTIDLAWLGEHDFGEAALGDLPLVVLERGRGRDAGWSDVQVELAALSENSLHAVGLVSGHHIQASQPELVVAAIRAVAKAGVEQSPLPACEKALAAPETECR